MDKREQAVPIPKVLYLICFLSWSVICPVRCSLSIFFRLREMAPSSIYRIQSPGSAFLLHSLHSTCQIAFFLLWQVLWLFALRSYSLWRLCVCHIHLLVWYGGLVCMSVSTQRPRHKERNNHTVQDWRTRANIFDMPANLLALYQGTWLHELLCQCIRRLRITKAYLNDSIVARHWFTQRSFPYHIVSRWKRKSHSLWRSTASTGAEAKAKCSMSGTCPVTSIGDTTGSFQRVTAFPRRQN